MMRWLVSDQSIILKSTDTPDNNVNYKFLDRCSSLPSSRNRLQN